MDVILLKSLQLERYWDQPIRDTKKDHTNQKCRLEALSAKASIIEAR